MIFQKRSEQRFLSDLCIPAQLCMLTFYFKYCLLFAKLPNICPCEIHHQFFNFYSHRDSQERESISIALTHLCCACYIASQEPSWGYWRAGRPFNLTHVITQTWNSFERCQRGGIGSSYYHVMVTPQCGPMDNHYPYPIHWGVMKSHDRSVWRNHCLIDALHPTQYGVGSQLSSSETSVLKLLGPLVVTDKSRKTRKSKCHRYIISLCNHLLSKMQLITKALLYMILSFPVRRRTTSRVALYGVVQRHYVMKPIGRDVEDLPTPDNCVNCVDISEVVASSLADVTPVDCWVSVGWVSLIGYETQLLTLVRWIKNIPLRPFQHSHHISSGVIMGFRDHTSHPKSTLNPFIRHNIRNEEIIF